jgi:alpha-L-rhamnosidase
MMNKSRDGDHSIEVFIMDTITALRCEHVEKPLGVETMTPRLSWQLRSTRLAARQTAYRIMVASELVKLQNQELDLWDSGRVDTDASVLVPYAGRKLRSRQQCWWQVQVWTDTSAVVLSEPSYWEMGLLRPDQWRAQWITAGYPVKADTAMAAPLLRREFKLRQQVARARVYVCGLGFYELYLNGRKVSDAVLHPAFTKYDERVLYTVFDIADYLVPQENAVGLILGNGWYNHHSQVSWNFQAASWRDECKALVQIEITYVNGQQEIITSNALWQSALSPIRSNDLRTGEVYDARTEVAGWCSAGLIPSDARLSDSLPPSWYFARIARPPGGRLHSQLMPLCRVTGTVRPVQMHEVKPGCWVFDLGCNIAGWARLSVNGPAGTRITMRYAERLTPEGDIDQSAIYCLKDDGEFQTDKYILKGDGPEVWEPRFAYHGFQYVQVTGLPTPPTPDTITGCLVHTDLKSIGSFSCSNPLLNQIQQAALRSTLFNYHGMPTDCPQREKNGWTGDAHLSAEQTIYNFDVTSAYRKWLDDFADCQRHSGALPGIVPSAGWGYNWGAGPAWDSAFILIPWYLYIYRGDVEILQRHYAGMKRYLEFLAAMATDDIVHFGLGDWCPPTPASYQYKAPPSLTNTAYYYVDVSLVAKIAAILGKTGDAARYGRLAQRIKASARKHFYNPQDQRLVGHGQTAIACFLYQGLTEDDEQSLFKQFLLDAVAMCNDHLDCGILGTKYLLHTLTDLGEAEVAYRIVTQTDYPSWGYWLAQGATTLWEAWDGRASHNHHMFSDVSSWFYKTLAGIQPDPAHPGFKHIHIKPWPVGDLVHATGETHTPYGMVHSNWQIEHESFYLTVDVPANSTATVYVPFADTSMYNDNKRPTAVEGSGVNDRGNRRQSNQVQASEGAVLLRITADRYVYRIGSGRYTFTASFRR